VTVSPLEAAFVRALAALSPLARRKIRATLLDFTMEITHDEWARVFNAHDTKQQEPQVCGCLMLDGYFKEYPPKFTIVHNVEDKLIIDDSYDDDWDVTLVDFYEMEDYEDATAIISNVAVAYDHLIKLNAEYVKIVGGVEVLRRPARRGLVGFVDEAEKVAS
jgi:hypothetical protein